MKHHLIICILFLSLGLSHSANTQPPSEGMKEKAKEKIEALRKAYITDKLALTEEESEAFWPIYETYKNEEKALYSQIKRNKKRGTDISEEEASSLIDQKLEIESQIIDLKKKYVQKMKAVIPAKKLIRLERVEKRFRTEVMKRMKDRRDKMKERGRGGERFNRGDQD